jgi:hypothetical protein
MGPGAGRCGPPEKTGLAAEVANVLADAGGAQHFTAEEVGGLLTPPCLNLSGLPADGMRLLPDLEDPAGTDLCLTRGQHEDRVRFTPAGLAELRLLLLGQGADGPMAQKQRREQLQELVRADHGKLDFGRRVEIYSEAGALADECHQAGYRLGVDDCRVTDQAPVHMLERLNDLLAQRLADEAQALFGATADVKALRRVIAMLEKS